MKRRYENSIHSNGEETEPRKKPRAISTKPGRIWVVHQLNLVLRRADVRDCVGRTAGPGQGLRMFSAVRHQS
jgi:hypothetical protein